MTDFTDIYEKVRSTTSPSIVEVSGLSLMPAWKFRFLRRSGAIRERKTNDYSVWVIVATIYPQAMEFLKDRGRYEYATEKNLDQIVADNPEAFS